MEVQLPRPLHLTNWRSLASGSLLHHLRRGSPVHRRPHWPLLLLLPPSEHTCPLDVALGFPIRLQFSRRQIFPAHRMRSRETTRVRRLCREASQRMMQLPLLRPLRQRDQQRLRGVHRWHRCGGSTDGGRQRLRWQLGRHRLLHKRRWLLLDRNFLSDPFLEVFRGHRLWRPPEQGSFKAIQVSSSSDPRWGFSLRPGRRVFPT